MFETLGSAGISGMDDREEYLVGPPDPVVNRTPVTGTGQPVLGTPGSIHGSWNDDQDDHPCARFLR